MALNEEDDVMKRLFVAGALLLSFALLGGEARAQSGTARGKVLDDKGQPVPDARIEMVYQGGVTRKFETKTNKKGEFVQVGIYPGVYRITATKEGYQGTYIEMKITFGEPTYIPDFKLVPGQVAAQAGAASRQEEINSAFKKAVELSQAGKLDEAEAAYKEMLAKDPDIPEVHFNLGYIYSQKKDFAAAEAEYKKALELRPNYTDASAALARIYQESGQADKATELMSKTATENPEDAKAQFNMGVVYLNAGKSEEAIASFQKVVAADPTMAEAYYHLGTLMVGQNKIGEAVSYLEKYLSMTPGNAQNVATAQGLLAALKPRK